MEYFNLIILAISNILCFWLGAKVANKEPVITVDKDVEIKPPDYMGNEDDGQRTADA